VVIGVAESAPVPGREEEVGREEDAGVLVVAGEGGRRRMSRAISGAISPTCRCVI